MLRWTFALLLLGSEPPDDPEPPRPVTAADLHAVRILHWDGRAWPITLDAAGRYHCGEAQGTPPHPDGSATYWSGTWRLNGDGTATLSEGRYRAAPDLPPAEMIAPAALTLKVRWNAGELVGFGWNEPIRLETR